jgi:uncharacterized membrane protein YcaP (DUF421 family)
MNDLAGMALRIGLTYVFVLAVLRLAGKRTLHALAPFDFVVATALGDVLDDTILGNVPAAHGLAVVAVLAGLHVLVSLAASRSQAIDRLLAPEPAVLVRQGKLDQAAAARERLSRETVLSLLRLRGEDDLRVIDQAVMEANGEPGVLRKKQARPLKRGDVPALRRLDD